jgi:error-prone DNA polymerase
VWGDERGDAVRAAAARQSRAPLAVVPARAQPVQLSLDLGDAPDETTPSGLPEMTGAERVRAELEVLGLDVSRHVLDFYVPLLEALGVTRAKDVLNRRSRSELLVAGVKVATQTPPVRSGRRVVFLTLDDATGPVDATFFEDVQGPYAATVFHSWLLVVRGVLRRTGPRGVSLRATGAWELPVLWDAWVGAGDDGGDEGLAAVLRIIAGTGGRDTAGQQAIAGAAASRSSRPVMSRPPSGAPAPALRLPAAELGGGFVVTPEQEREAQIAAAAATGLPAGDRPEYRSGGSSGSRAGGMGGGGDGEHLRRVLVHASGFVQSPYADLKPPGEDTRDTRRMLAAEEGTTTQERRRREPPRKLWHASPGSSGR